jgi:tetratricopeptide (TPR) repeat protein
MSTVAKLKKKAVEFEQKRQYDKALALYVQVLDESAAEEGEPEVALYNRVGDLLLRLGNVEEAVKYYGRAVDLYAEGGFLNNAIALCNKILRHDPGQSTVHYTLGRISAQKGFRSDAKQHFLEYAGRMQRAGDLDESFRALKEFADLCPDQDDIRLMLAEQLTRQGRTEEAIEQLQLLHEKLVADGRTSEARAAAERLVALDPAAAPRAGGATSAPKSESGLVFLDVSWEEQRPGSKGASGSGSAGRASSTESSDEGPAAHASEPASILDREEPAAQGNGALAPAPLEGLEPTALELDPPTEAPVLNVGESRAPDDSYGLRDLERLATASAAEPDGHAGGSRDLPAPVPELLPLDLAPPAMFDPDPSNAGARASEADAVRSEAGGGPLGDGLALVFPDDVYEDSEGPDLTLIMPEPFEEEPNADAGGSALTGLPMLEAPRPGPAADAGASGDPEADGFVNLGDWLRDEEPPKSTRMVVDAVEPGEGEEFDFDDMLRKFKRGVAENVDADDHESHYDLGVAFREMGLVDEAVAEFQKALRGTSRRARTHEALGQCFMDKSQYQVAATVLSRALNESPGDDQQLVGVLYLLGTASEALGRHDEAIAFYQRVFAIDIGFRDVEDRLNALERTTR